MTFPEPLTTFWSQHVTPWWNPSGYLVAVPPADWPLKWAYVGFTLLCLIVGIAFLFLKRQFRPSLRYRILNFAWTNAILGIVLFFLRDQQIPYLGSDLLRLVQIIGAVFWINSLAWFVRTSYKQEQYTEAVMARREKYLPTARP
jgi:hypothetical protein